MPEATEEQLQALAPYIAGAQPDARGEIEIYCPTHPDQRRSASLNPEKGVWYCHAGCGGGSVRQLVLNEDGWVPMDGRAVVAAVAARTSLPVAAVRPTMAQVQHWHRRLRREPGVQQWLLTERGITADTCRKALIGYDGVNLKIPVFSPQRRIWNVRTYDPAPDAGSSKMWNTRGLGKARLYPIGPLTRLEMNQAVLFCEGEWDTLLALQHGFAAVTRTDGAGKPWHDAWTSQFVGLNVYTCFDCDRAGQAGAADVAAGLSDVARVYHCRLPFEIRPKGGQDLSDHLLSYEPEDRTEMLAKLFRNAKED